MCTACTRSGSAGECIANVRMWMPSAGTAQLVAMEMVEVGFDVWVEVADVGGVEGADGASDVGASGDARDTVTSVAVSGASVAPAVAHAASAARSVPVMLA